MPASKGKKSNGGGGGNNALLQEVSDEEEAKGVIFALYVVCFAAYIHVEFSTEIFPSPRRRHEKNAR